MAPVPMKGLDESQQVKDLREKLKKNGLLNPIYHDVLLCCGIYQSET
jgi:hypothetical protein